MNITKTAIVIFSAMFLVVSASRPVLAAGPSGPAGPSAALSALAGMQVSTAQLSRQRGKAFIVSSSNSGVDSGNTVIDSPTGNIVDKGANLNGGNGIMTIFQNTGNNTLLQNSTTVNISIN